MSDEAGVPVPCKETLALQYSIIQPNLSGLMGKILTIIDASIPGEQNKAVKDLVKNSFNETQNWFYDISHSRKSTQDYGEFGYPFEGQVIPVEK